MLGGTTVDLQVTTYLAYLAIAVPLTVWVGRALRRHGAVFLIDVFAGDEHVAQAVNQLLVIGFYLLNLGYVLFFMATSTEVTSTQQMLEILSTKVGAVALVIGVVHIANVAWLNSLRKRALLRAQSVPPVPPNAYTPIAGPSAA
jgi:hypothetical protein